MMVPVDVDPTYWGTCVLLLIINVFSFHGNPRRMKYTPHLVVMFS